MDYKQLRALADEHVQACDEILKNHPLTEEQGARAAQHLRKGWGLVPRLEQARSDENIKRKINELGSAIGHYAPGAADAGVSTGGPKLKALGGSDWGATLLRTHASDDYGFKAIAPSGTSLVTIPLNTEPVKMGEPVLALRQLLPAERDEAGLWSYLVQTARTQAAAPVAAGAKKPTSAYTLERREGRSVTLAHLSEPIERQHIADAPLLQEFIDSEMRLGIENAIETQVLTGDGTGDNFLGLNATSGVQVQPAVVDPAGTPAGFGKLLALRRAITRLEAQSIAPTGLVMAPSDWEAVETIASQQGMLLTPAGQQTPVERASRRIWGVPVVLSTSATAGTAWLADFAGSTILKVREEVNLTWSENTYDANALGAGIGASDFERNLVRFRAEGRFGFAVKRPLGVVKVALA